jgi:hypothetical protein
VHVHFSVFEEIRYCEISALSNLFDHTQIDGSYQKHLFRDLNLFFYFHFCLASIIVGPQGTDGLIN